MAPLSPLSVKIEDDLQADLLTIATRRQEETGERTTVSDVIRDILSKGVANENARRPSSMIIEDSLVDVCEPYSPIGRKLLFTFHQEDSNFHVVERSVSTKSYVIGMRGRVPDPNRSNRVPDQLVEHESMLIPAFEVATNPQWHMREGLTREEEIITRAKDSVARQEDHEIISRISRDVSADHTIVSEERLSPPNIGAACRLLWEHEIKIANIVFNPIWADDIQEWMQANESNGGMAATVSQLSKHYSPDFQPLSSTMCPKDTVLVMGPPEMVGRIRIGVDVNVIPCDDPKMLRYGRIIWESIGVCVINDYAIAKVHIV